MLWKKQNDLAILLKSLARKTKKSDAYSIPLVVLEEAIRLKDLDSFKASLDKLCTNFAAKGTLRILKKYLYPHLDHVRSFNNDMSRATNSQSIASLTWGLLLLVIQVSHT